VFPAGLAILLEIVENFVSTGFGGEGAMREGLLYDLMAASRTKSPRAQCARHGNGYHVDGLQRDRSRRRRLRCSSRSNLNGVWRPARGVGAALGGAAARNGLEHRALQYQRHSAYLLQHATCRVFARGAVLVSALVGGHRRQLSFESLEDLLPPWIGSRSF